MGVYKRGDTWGISYFRNGKRIRKAIGKNRKKAEAILENIKVDIRAGRYRGEEDLQEKTMEELYEIYMQRHQGKARYDEGKLMEVTRNYFSGRLVSKITEDDVESFLAERRKAPTRKGGTRAASTINRSLALSGSWEGRLWHMAPSNPARNVKLTRTEGASVPRARGHAPNLRYPASIVVCALGNRRRQGEILRPP
jgi:hypothetical protein